MNIKNDSTQNIIQRIQARTNQIPVRIELIPEDQKEKQLIEGLSPT